MPTFPAARRRAQARAVLMVMAPLSMGCADAVAAPAAKDLVYSFSGPDGARPFGTLVADTSGALYGAAAGGANNTGAIFRLVPPGRSGGTASETVLYSFPANTTNAIGQLAIGADGTLYGTVQNPSTADPGSIFALTPPAAGGTAWGFNEIYHFTGGADAQPNSITIGPDGALYGGTTGSLGEIYRLAHGANGWAEQVLYLGQAGSPPAGPAVFAGHLVFGPDGSIYGVSNEGPGSSANENSIFRLTPPSAGGTAYMATVLFNGAVFGDLALALPNTIFAQFSGGPDGALYILSPPASGTSWNLSSDVTFNGLTGSDMNTGIAATYNKAQNTYTIALSFTSGGGRGAEGLVASLTVSPGKVLRESFPHIFYKKGGDGVAPSGGLLHVAKSAHNNAAYYGVTASGGAHDLGAVYRLK